jgi:CRP/FNR family transcriptional regulator, cyclic AMP receptor protein
MAETGSPARHELTVRLAALPGWFADMPEPSRAAFLSVAMARRFLPGQAMLHAGDPDGGMLGVVRGAVEVRAGDASPDSAFTFIHHPGAWIGYGPVLGKPRALNARATTVVDALLLPEAALHALLDQHPQLWRHIAELAYLDMASALGGCGDLLIYAPRQRLAAVLLWLTGNRQTNRDDMVSLRMTQSQLAQILHTSRSSLAPMLAEFESLGFVEAGYGAVTVCNPDALRAIADDC